jgi:hypothetical protein
MNVLFLQNKKISMTKNYDCLLQCFKDYKSQLFSTYSLILPISDVGAFWNFSDIVYQGFNSSTLD